MTIMENKPTSAEGQVKQKRKYKKKLKKGFNYNWEDINLYIMGVPIKGIVYMNYNTPITVTVGFVNDSGERAPNDILK